MYFNKELGQVTSTYLALVEMEACDAEAITIGIKTTLKNKGLDLQKLIGIGTDNASLMVGINNGVYKKLKEDIPTLIHVPCICHSLQLAVSAAASETLPRNIEYMIRETYNWFSHSSLRQAQYKNLFKAINEGHEPLNIVKACDTRWLPIETAVSRISNQWLELKTLFGIAKLKEKCYAADILHNMFVDDRNLAYLKFLHPVLEEVQKVNKSFESNTADPSKLLNDLVNLVNSIARRFVVPDCRQNPLICNMDSYVSPNVYFGYEFNQVVSKLSPDDQTVLKHRCVQFLKVLLKQLQQRLPKNVQILEKVSLISPKSALSVIKEPLTPLAELFQFEPRIIDKINIQWDNLTNIKWLQTDKTFLFWKEVCDYRDASETNPFEELCTLTMRLLVLPWSNADVERLFSQMNLVKTKLRNRMGSKLLDSILTIKSGLRRQNVCCENYLLPMNVLKQISMPSFLGQEEDMLIDDHLDLNIL